MEKPYNLWSHLLKLGSFDSVSSCPITNKIRCVVAFTTFTTFISEMLQFASCDAHNTASDSLSNTFTVVFSLS